MKKMLVLCLTALTIFTSQANYAAEKSTNIRVSPIPLVIGALNIEADIKAAQKFTVGPMLTYWKFNGDSVDGDSTSFKMQGYGVRADYHPRGTFKQGFFLGGIVKHWSFDITEVDNSVLYTGSAEQNTIGLLAGYRWMWDSVNTTVELGRGFSIGDELVLRDQNGNKKDNNTGSGEPMTLIFDFSVGWSF